MHERMLWRVARARGPELSAQVAFVGGCATPMLITDDFSRENVRFTDDVDVIVQALGRGGWYRLEKALAARGFHASIEDDILCRKRLRDDEPVDLIVDFMPDDPAILGFSNRWYADALRSAEKRFLPDGTMVRVVAAPYFLATKFEAYRGRGEGRPLASTDVGDILDLMDGRSSLVEEVRLAPSEISAFVAKEFSALLAHQDFMYALQSCVKGSSARERLLLARISALCG